MNNLLKFFIPKSVISILTFFGYGLAACCLIHFLPIADGAKEMFRFMLIGLIFPAISYFNSQSFMNSSVPWIVLSPVPKKEIIYANGVNNILKVILIYGLYKIFELGEHKIYNVTQDDYLFSALKTLDFSAQSIMFGVVFITIMLIFLFGILPSYAARMQTARDYKISKNVFKSKKFFYKFGAVILILMIYANTEELISHYAAVFYVVPFVTVFMLVAFLAATLESVKYYYSNKKIIVFGVVLAVALSTLFYVSAKNDLNNPDRKIADRLSSMGLLIPFEGVDARNQMRSEIIESPVGHKILTRGDLKDVFSVFTGDAETAGMVKSLMENCRSRRDHTCRIVTYFKEFKSNEPGYVDLLRDACINDVGSCIILADINSIEREEVNRLHSRIEMICKQNQELDEPSCKVFNKRKYAKTKAKTKKS